MPQREFKIVLEESRFSTVKRLVELKINELLSENEELLRELTQILTKGIKNELIKEVSADKYSELDIEEKLNLVMNSLEHNVRKYFDIMNGRRNNQR